MSAPPALEASPVARAALRDLLSRLLASAGVPSGEIVFVHARLRGLRDRFALPYASITECILETLRDELSAPAILVPTYTNASFRYTRIFHRRFSRSEVGRFSEEVRAGFAQFRTPDPIYSVADTGGYLERLEGIDYTRTYGPASLFDALNRRGYVILNLGLEYLVATQLHAAERLAEVPYRFERDVTGVVYLDEREWREITYRTYLLNSSRIGVTHPEWDRARIEATLLEHEVLRLAACGTTRLAWTYSQRLTDVVTELLRDEPTLLLEPGSAAPQTAARR